MFLYKNRIVITGGTGRFGQELKKIKNKYKLFFPKKNELNILKTKSIKNYLKLKKPKYLIHLAGLSRPMKMHDTFLSKSIDLNIIGTANVTKICSDLNVKLIYFSTSYVYPGTKGNYKEEDSLLPNNNYAWSKLGGECAVKMYKNSLIIRVNMTEMPFIHKKAFANVKINFLYQHEVAQIIFKLIHKRGIINIGGKPQTIFNFAKENSPKVRKSYAKKNQFPNNLTMNLSKFKKIIR